MPLLQQPAGSGARRRRDDTAGWLRVLDEAAALGVLQMHFTGGEPMARRDHHTLIRHAASARHVHQPDHLRRHAGRPRHGGADGGGHRSYPAQLPGHRPAENDRTGAHPGAFTKKRAAAAWIREAGLPLTLNFVLHRAQSSPAPPAMIAFAEQRGRRPPGNRPRAILWLGPAQPRRPAADARPAGCRDRAGRRRARAAARQNGDRLRGARLSRLAPQSLHGRLGAAHHEHLARRAWRCPATPRKPCPASHSRTCATTAWPGSGHESDAFTRFRGTDWMPEPCRSCDRKEIDWGGCRCQAFALTGRRRAPPTRPARSRRTTRK